MLFLFCYVGSIRQMAPYRSRYGAARCSKAAYRISVRHLGIIEHRGHWVRVSGFPPATVAAARRRAIEGAGFRPDFRKEWTGEQFEAVASHPDCKVRELLGQAVHVRPEQRARLVEDPESAMHRVLADAATLADEVVEGKPAGYLGRWSPDQLPAEED